MGLQKPESSAKICTKGIDETPQRGLNEFTCIVLLVSLMGGLLNGLDIGTCSITSMNHFRRSMDIPIQRDGIPDSAAVTQKVSLFAVVYHVASFFGAPIAGSLSDRIGRKPVILVSSIIFMTGAVIQACAGVLDSHNGWTCILLGRVIGGLGCGFVLTIMPVYASELAPSRYRGQVLTLFQLSVTVGIFLMSVINKLLENEDWGWRVGFAAQCVPCAVVIVLTLCLLPESPRHLIRKNQGDRARLALLRLAKGTPNAEAVVEAEIKDTIDELAELSAIGEGSFMELFLGTTLPVSICAVFVSLAQNITGVNWFMNYSTHLFSSLHFEPFLWDLLLKLLNMLATFVAIFWVDRFGRKFLAVWGTLVILVVYFLIFAVIVATGVEVTEPNPNKSARIVQSFVVAMIFVYQATFAVTWGPLAYIVPAEIFPIRVRGKGMSISIMANMLTNVVCGDYGYVNLNSATNIQTTTGIVLLVNVFLVFTTAIFVLPETKDVSLEDMRKIFGYERGGNEELGHGSIRSFYMRNTKQTYSVLRCRAVNPEDDIKAFDFYTTNI